MKSKPLKSFKEKSKKDKDIEEIFIESLKAFRKWMSHWVLQLKKKHLLLLSGPMGVGKTQFVRFLVEALEEKEGNKKEQVFSPSFTVYNQYKVGQVPISHVDLYRLKVEEELDSIGFSDLFQVKCGIVIVEWSEHLNESFVPLDWSVTKIKMGMMKENEYKEWSEKAKNGPQNNFPLSDLENVQNEKRKLLLQSSF